MTIIYRRVALFGMALCIFLGGANVALAVSTVTAATGGANISADTAGDSYTTLTGPVLIEGATADIGEGAIILNAPAGFVFDTTGAPPTVLITRTGGSGNNSKNINHRPSGSFIAATRTASTLEIAINSSTSGDVTNSLTWQNVRVRPVAGIPLASGTITKAGDSTIIGVTDSVTSFGVLTEVAGAVTQFTLDNPGDTAAGSRIGYTVTRKDQFGNAVTSGATAVYLYNSSTGAEQHFYDAASGGNTIVSLSIAGGASSAQFWSYDEKAGDWFITVSDNAGTPDGATGIADASDALTVVPSAMAAFKLDNPGNMTINTRLGYVVSRADSFGNPVTSGVALAHLYTSSIGTTTAFYPVAFGGAATTFATINDGSSSGTFWYYDTEPGDWTVTVSDNMTAPDGAAGIADASDQVTVSSIPITATRLVIVSVTSVQVGTPVTVTVEAQDDMGNIDTTINASVTLVADGSATGAGAITLVNGIGTKSISDTIAETVTLSLVDSASTGLDVSSIQQVTFSETPVAPSTVSGGGAGELQPQQHNLEGVIISGYAFPGAVMRILSVLSGGETEVGETIASEDGAFLMFLPRIASAADAYAVVGADVSGRTTQAKVFSVGTSSNGSFLTAFSQLFSPTLGLVHTVVRKGDLVGFVGMAIPGYTVGAQVDGKTVASTQVADDGSYKILFPTRALSTGSHTARVRQLSPSGVYSEYAPQKVFTVTTLFTPQTDFNQDGVINVQDWSIFLAQWSSAIPAEHLLDDLNGDGKVDVSDLSIFVRTLKK